MKKSIFKTSLLVTLSTLFVACGSHNHTSVNKETPKQPQQSQKPAPQTKPQANSQDKAPQEKPNNTEQSSSSSMQTENSTQNHSTEAGKEQKPSKPEQSMNTENPTDKKDEMNNTDTNNSSKNTQSDIPDSMKDNHKPNTQVNPPQIPPKTENPTNSNNMSNKDMRKEKEKENQSIKTPKPEEKPQSDTPNPSLPPHLLGLGNWEGKTCDSHGNCRNSAQDPKNIYESPIPPTSKISLKLGKNKEGKNNYEFILLGESEDGSIYYGYRSYNVSYQNDETKKVYDIIQGINKKRINRENISDDFNAKYYKKQGFLYIPFSSLSTISKDKHAPQYADINITYKNGNATGTVTKSDKDGTVIFNITDDGSRNTDNYTLTVTPTGKDSNIESDDKAKFNVYFLDAENNKEEHKYITGAGSGKKWAGVFAAEKQKTTTSTTKAE
ncbi:outer membrane lopoprotein PlpP [Pasteurella canis]|uniref:Outer membrane lopoprotein PlpP n=1 Tax=Pasteurella canis TaxID=753 RepID=A0A379EW72_9PAST|nr:hypothetical protein [Pasteurella canis]SUC10453.1 outer membrane lopoprotein PlpP [Pasteurella canis]